MSRAALPKPSSGKVTPSLYDVSCIACVMCIARHSESGSIQSDSLSDSLVRGRQCVAPDHYNVQQSWIFANVMDIIDYPTVQQIYRPCAYSCLEWLHHVYVHIESPVMEVLDYRECEPMDVTETADDEVTRSRYDASCVACIMCINNRSESRSIKSDSLSDSLMRGRQGVAPDHYNVSPSWIFANGIVIIYHRFVQQVY